MALIQDIKPRSGQPARYRVAQHAAVDRIKQFHQATIIPPLTMEPVKRFYHPRESTIDAPEAVSLRPRGSAESIQSTPLPHRPMSSSMRLPQRQPSAVSPQVARQPTKGVRRKTRAKIFDFMQYPLFALCALGAAWSPVIGQLFIAVYFMVSLRYKLTSRLTFSLVLVMLACILFFSVMGQVSISDNVAIYTYELLLTGVIQVIIEFWRLKRVAPYS